MSRVPAMSPIRRITRNAFERTEFVAEVRLFSFFIVLLRVNLPAAHLVRRGNRDCVSVSEQLMAGLAKHIYDAFHAILRDQHIVGVVSRDGEDRNTVRGKRFDE